MDLSRRHSGPHPPAPDRADNITRQYDDGRMQPVDHDATITWHDLLRQVDTGGTFWLTVVGDDGRPHTRPVFAVVHDGTLVTASSDTAVKTAPLQAGRPCSIAASAGDLDVVWSGIPARVTDTDELHDIADRYRQSYGWHVDAHGDALSAPYGAPTAGPPPYVAFRIRPSTVHAIATGDASTGRSTRWTFPPADPSARPR